MFISQKNKFCFLIIPSVICQVFFSRICFSQNQFKIDSLLNTLKTAKEDTNKANELQYLSHTLSLSDPDNSLSYAQQELALSQKLNFKQGIINAYQSIAGFYFEKGNFTNALNYSIKAIPFIEQTNNKLALAESYNHLSSIALEQGNYSSSMDYSNKALQLADEIKDTTLITKITNNRGVIYMYIADYPTALNYFLDAIKICQAKKNKLSLSFSYYNIGLIYQSEHNSDKAIDYYQESYKTAKEINNRIMMADGLRQMGEIFQYEKKWDKALDYLQQSISMNQEMSDSVGICTTTREIAMIYNEQGKFTKAIQSASIALQIAEKIGVKLEISNSYECLGECYMKHKDYVKAINYLLKGLDIANEIGQKTNQSSICANLAKSYQSINDFKSAYNYASQNISLNDSILTEETAKKAVEIGAVYTSEKKEKEIALLTKDKKIQELEIKKQASLKYSFMAGLVLVCILFFFIYRNYRIRQTLNVQQLRNKIALDLHDEVGSSLSSIKIFSELARSNPKEFTPTLDRIIDYSQETIESIADIVWAINPDNDSFEKIIVRMRSFARELLEAKNIRFEFNINNSLEELKLSMDERKNLYLIFKEAVNNMIKHSEANHAIFSISNANNELKVLIRDNGKGFDINQQTQGNGLNNMKKRAFEIGADYFIESGQGKGTSIQLLIKTAT